MSRNDFDIWYMSKFLHVTKSQHVLVTALIIAMRSTPVGIPARRCRGTLVYGGAKARVGDEGRIVLMRQKV